MADATPSEVIRWFEEFPPKDPRVVVLHALRVVAERDALAARVAELEAALQPFAEYGRACPPCVQDHRDTSPYTWFSVEPGGPNTPTVGHCRRAAELLAQNAPPETTP